MNIELMKEYDDLLFGIIRAAIIPVVPPKTNSEVQAMIAKSRQKQTFSFGVVKVRGKDNLLMMPTAIENYERDPFKSFFKISGIDSKSQSSLEELDIDTEMLYSIDEDGFFEPLILQEDFTVYQEALS